MRWVWAAVYLAVATTLLALGGLALTMGNLVGGLGMAGVGCLALWYAWGFATGQERLL